MPLTTPKFQPGDKIMIRGEIAQVTEVRVMQRETPEEHIEYEAETVNGQAIRVREDAVKRHQQQLF
ncbi:hypothetical protein FP507_10550 [Chlorobium phaeovibrioides]|uniref:Uncharacterized protein n=1 Tax=Chlorobium phaeovibrioides TaxID=1094 RepID=A0A5M8I6R3_CHLPH|nr:hypothetical protein [Chlorobium phaeovibrioides]KAA6230670.1 hypothetical protein FP507_10550 [Chlorobium phaeovibrioides]